MTSSNASPIVVVGAGIIGLFTALHLREATRRDVLVIEAGDVGDGTTPAGAGFVAPWATVLPHLGVPGLALEEYSLAVYAEIAASGANIRHRNNGNIVFFNHQESFDAGVAAIMGGPCVSDDTRVIDAAELAELTSGAVDARRVAGGVLMPRGIQFETGLLLAHLTTLAGEAGIEIRRHTTVDAVDAGAGGLAGVQVSSTAAGAGTAEVIATDCVVLAVGAWLNELLAPLDAALPLLPFVATRFVTGDLGVAPSMPTLQGKDFPLWIRESEGGFTWGSTPGAAPAHRLDSSWTSHEPAERAYEDLVDQMAADTDRIAEVFPALAGSEVVRIYQGMPVYTVDRQFFVGEVPGCAGLWVAGGDNESGVSHAPGLGRLVADLVTRSARPVCDPTLYRLDRYSPSDFPDAEAVGQAFVAAGEGFIAESMRAPIGSP